jgi:alpha/beta superfamily hydrolase
MKPTKETKPVNVIKEDVETALNSINNIKETINNDKIKDAVIEGATSFFITKLIKKSIKVIKNLF